MRHTILAEARLVQHQITHPALGMTDESVTKLLGMVSKLHAAGWTNKEVLDILARHVPADKETS